jgi:hypothetical protein
MFILRKDEEHGYASQRGLIGLVCLFDDECTELEEEAVVLE